MSGERRSRRAWLWWQVSILLLTCAGCAPLATSSRLAGSDIQGYEAPGAVDYPPALLEKVADALAAQGRYRRGPVYGIAMQNALRGVQLERELPVTGRLDAETLLALAINPLLLPGGLPPVKPDPLSQLLSRMETTSHPQGAAAPPAPPEHSPGRFSPTSPLAHLSAPVAALVKGKKVFGTGFLIGPDILLTSARSLTGSGPCAEIVARFNDQEDASGRSVSPADYGCLEVLAVDPELDYGLLRLAGEPGYDWGYLELSDERVEEGEPLAVIGHPGGSSKRIYEECRVDQAAAGRNLTFSCGAEIKMPGAPVISRHSRRVVAMVRAGRSPERGEGTSAERLLAACLLCEPLQLGSGRIDLGDGGRDFFLKQGGRLGLLRNRQNDWQSEWLPAEWLEQWSLPGRYQAHALDIDGDGEGELVLKNSRWLAVFKGHRGQPRLHWIAHERIGPWQLGGEDRAWPGDFNGDGRGDLLVFDGRRLGLLLADGRKLTGSWVSGRNLKGWRFEPADRFTIGDFNGDGWDDVLAHRGQEAAVFFSRGQDLELVWTADARVGSWKLAPEDEHLVGDFTGDGCDEVLTHREGELALWKMAGGTMELQWRQRRQLGSWRLGWQDRLLVADFNGDGRDDVLIRSNEWMGLLISSGRYFTTPWLRFDRFRGWDLTPFDRELTGDFNRDGRADLLIIGPWGSGRFLSTGSGFVEDRAGGELVSAPDP